MRYLVLFIFSLLLLSCTVYIRKYTGKKEFISVENYRKEETKVILFEPLIITSIDFNNAHYTVKPVNFSPYGRGHVTFPTAWDSILKVIDIYNSGAINLKDVSCFSTQITPINFLKPESSIFLPRFIQCMQLPNDNNLYVFFAFNMDYCGSCFSDVSPRSDFNAQLVIIKNNEPMYYRKVKSWSKSASRENRDFPVKLMYDTMWKLVKDIPWIRK